MGEFKCPVPECEHAPFQTVAGLKSHLRTKHPDFTLEEMEEAREVPIVEEDFASLLKKFKIKSDLAANIAENISHTGGPTVFEEPELLFKRLTAWSSDVNPSRRKLIIEQWFAEKGIGIPAEVQQKAGMTTDQIQKEEAGIKEGVEVRYVFDEEKRVVRMAKERERGGTLAQAKELKTMAEESERAGAESPFIPDAEGNLMLNPKARITGIELMAYEMIKKAQEKGEPLDPLEAMAQAAEKMKLYREALGGVAGNVPGWMTDPAAFINLIRDITGAGDRGGKPDWLSDPAAFIETIRKITPEPKTDDTVKTELAEVRKTLEDMKEERHRQEIAALASQMKAQQEAYNKEMREVLDKMEDLRKPATGRTEMDILHEIATEGIGVIKTEAAGMRGMLREVVSGSGLPAAKSPEEREERKGKYRKALQTDREIEQLGQRLFFGQS